MKLSLDHLASGLELHNIQLLAEFFVFFFFFVGVGKMPSNFFSSLRRGFQWGAWRSIVGQEGGQQESVETLIGQGKLLFGNSRFLHSGSSATFSDLNIFLRPGSLAAAQSNLHLVNRTKNISVVRAVSHTFSIPSVSGPSFEACGYQMDCLLSKPTDLSVGRSTQKKTMAVCGSDFLPSNCSFSGLSSRCAHPRLLANGSFACYNNGSVDSCRISMSLSRNKLPNDLWLYGYYAYNVAKRRGDFNQACGLRGLHVSPACLSAGTAPDVSFENSALEEQLANYANSTELKLSGDRTVKLRSGSCYLPHPDKEETGGEDAHFICADEQAIGVADGVGGWADLGVDAGQYARELMSNSANAVQEEPKGSVDTARVLEKAYSSTKAKGSSTACVIALTDQGLHAVNLGDSGFMVIRDGSTVFRSPTQQHDFNFTYQLESGNSGDLPSSGQVYTIPVAPGDVIIAGTDGLFDNLYNQDITAVVVHAMRAGLGPQVTAQKIAALARQRAQDKNRQTPFSAAAQDAGFRYYGGKLDDITVVISYITSADKCRKIAQLQAAHS